MDNRSSGHEELLTLTADIVSSHVSNNSVSVSDLSTLISNIYATLSGLGTKPEPSETKPEPIVPIRNSIKPDYIVCLEDGRKLKTLKRHLMTRYNLTPEAYRTKWGLPATYPMVAPAYAERRRELAVNMGLGKKPAEKPAQAKPATRASASAAAPKKPGPRAATRKTAEAVAPAVAVATGRGRRKLGIAVPK